MLKKTQKNSLLNKISNWLWVTQSVIQIVNLKYSTMKNAGKTWKFQITFFFNGYSILANLLPKQPKIRNASGSDSLQGLYLWYSRHKDKTKQNCISEQLLYCSVAKIKRISKNYLICWLNNLHFASLSNYGNTSAVTKCSYCIFSFISIAAIPSF